MRIERSRVGAAEVIRLTGRLDSTTSPAFEAQVLSTVRPESNRLVLDFSNVDYVSSAGLRVVLIVAKQTRATQGGFAIFGMAPAIQSVFRMSGFSRIIAVFDDEAAAVASVTPQAGDPAS